MNVTNIKNTSPSYFSKAKDAASSEPVKDAAKFAGAVIGGSAVLGIGYAVFAKTANALYSAMN